MFTPLYSGKATTNYYLGSTSLSRHVAQLEAMVSTTTPAPVDAASTDNAFQSSFCGKPTVTTVSALDVQCYDQRRRDRL
jgi:hypothetical protein